MTQHKMNCKSGFKNVSKLSSTDHVFFRKCCKPVFYAIDY